MKWTKISIQEAEQLLENQDVLLLDARDYTAYLAGHHPRALHLSGNNLRSLLKHTAHTVPVLIYCYHGHSSQDIAQLFADFGFISCYSLEGGYDAWRQRIARPQQRLSGALIDWLEERDFCCDNLDFRGANNDTALMVAAREGQAAFVGELVQAGASASLLNQDGNNALWMAVQSGTDSIVRALLRAGACVDNQNDHGATALMLAMSLGNVALVTLLLASGADWSLRTHDDFSAEDVAGNRKVLTTLLNITGRHRKYLAA